MESLVSNSVNNVIDEECELSSNNLSIKNAASAAPNYSNSIFGSNLRRRRHLSPANLRASAKYLAEVEEVRINPVISKKGYLNFLEEKSAGWTKRFACIRRPYVFIYNSDKEPLERSIFNLSKAQIAYNEQQIETLQVNSTRIFFFYSQTFSLLFKFLDNSTIKLLLLLLLLFFCYLKNQNTISLTNNGRGFLIQTLTDREIFDWLYALNPLLAGELRSKLARRRQQIVRLDKQSKQINS